MVIKSSLGLIFRTPEYGRVKKRLALEIGVERALLVYTEMLEATIKNISGLKDVDIFGFYEGNFPDINKKFIFKDLLPQKGDDFGAKLHKAIEYLYKRGYKKIALIGSDSPDLPQNYIREAFSRLDNFDLVIGPSEDGGYYLIAMKEPLEFLFQNIPWGEREVLKLTIEKAKKKGLPFYLLPEWYDIDSASDLRRWPLNYDSLSDTFVKEK